MAKQTANHPFARPITKPKSEMADARTTKAKKQSSHSHFVNRKKIEATLEKLALKHEFELNY